jgi:hypothetical protein
MEAGTATKGTCPVLHVKVTQQAQAPGILACCPSALPATVDKKKDIDPFPSSLRNAGMNVRAFCWGDKCLPHPRLQDHEYQGEESSALPAQPGPHPFWGSAAHTARPLSGLLVVRPPLIFCSSGLCVVAVQWVARLRSRPLTLLWRAAAVACIHGTVLHTERLGLLEWAGDARVSGGWVRAQIQASVAPGSSSSTHSEPANRVQPGPQWAMAASDNLL